jgi:hypothetical protein
MGCPLRIIVVGITIAIASICVLFSMNAEPKLRRRTRSRRNDSDSDDVPGCGHGAGILQLMTGATLLKQYCNSRNLSPEDAKTVRTNWATIWKRPSVVIALVVFHIGLIIAMRICPYFGGTIVFCGALLASLVEVLHRHWRGTKSTVDFAVLQPTIQAVQS